MSKDMNKMTKAELVEALVAENGKVLSLEADIEQLMSEQDDLVAKAVAEASAQGQVVKEFRVDEENLSSIHIRIKRTSHGELERPGKGMSGLAREWEWDFDGCPMDRILAAAVRELDIRAAAFYRSRCKATESRDAWTAEEKAAFRVSSLKAVRFAPAALPAPPTEEDRLRARLDKALKAGAYGEVMKLSQQLSELVKAS